MKTLLRTKAILAAVLLGLATLPAIAQEACYTPAMIAADVAKVPNAKESITLRSIDVGFSELADVTIWGDGSGHHLAVVFIGGCYIGNQIMDDATVEAFITKYTKTAL